MARFLSLLGRTLSLLRGWRTPLLRWTSLRWSLLLLTRASGPWRILIPAGRSLLLAPIALHRRCLSLRVLAV